jgi:hypothetical protein
MPTDSRRGVHDRDTRDPSSRKAGRTQPVSMPGELPGKRGQQRESGQEALQAAALVGQLGGDLVPAGAYLAEHYPPAADGPERPGYAPRPSFNPTVNSTNCCIKVTDRATLTSSSAAYRITAALHARAPGPGSAAERTDVRPG